MIGDRQDRVINLIRELAAAYVQQEANTDPMITITSATTSADYRKATLFFTTIPEGKEADAKIFLTRSAGDLRQYLKKKCNLKIIPHIDFEIDVGERHRQHIDEISRNIESGEQN